jgi:hypothetical protein
MKEESVTMSELRIWNEEPFIADLEILMEKSQERLAERIGKHLRKQFDRAVEAAVGEYFQYAQASLYLNDHHGAFIITTAPEPLQNASTAMSIESFLQYAIRDHRPENVDRKEYFFDSPYSEETESDRKSTAQLKLAQMLYRTYLEWRKLYPIVRPPKKKRKRNVNGR